jgi:hypothetical protein
VRDPGVVPEWVGVERHGATTEHVEQRADDDCDGAADAIVSDACLTSIVDDEPTVFLAVQWCAETR